MADSKYKLSYFNLNGLGESIRLIFAYAGVPFEDHRVAFADWPAIKEEQPFHKLPVLEIDGKRLNQSVAICRFLGKKFGLVAEDSITDAFLEALVDNIRDYLIKVWKAMEAKTPEATKESVEGKTFLLTKLEKVASEGYFYGSKPTWADIYFTGIFDMMADFNPNPLEGYPRLIELTQKIKSKDSVREYLKNKPVPEPHPKKHDD